MREKLQPLAGQRLRWEARVRHFGDASNHASRLAVCIGPVKLFNTGEMMTGHIWLNLTSTLQKLNLVEGDTLTFDATVQGYWKGFHDHKTGFNRREVDYKLGQVASCVVDRAKAPERDAVGDFDCLLLYADKLVSEWYRLDGKASELVKSDGDNYKRVKSRQSQIIANLTDFYYEVLKPIRQWRPHAAIVLAQLQQLNPGLTDL